MAAEFMGAMPRLYGAPSYARPARNGVETHRPFDPDDQPLEAARLAPESPIEDAGCSEAEMATVDDWLARATRSPFGLARR